MRETWLNESNADVFQLDGNDFHHRNRVEKHGGGVAFFIKSIINYTIIQQLTVDVEDVFECLTVKLLFKTQTIVSCLYRKPSSKIADFMECIESINQSIKFISRSTCTKMNKKYIFHKLTGKRWKLKLTTYKHFPFVQ